MSAEVSPSVPSSPASSSGSSAPEVHQRQRMLNGMADTVAKHGYRGATITEVVRYAKVSKRTFYEEFGDKESCFLELYDRTRRELEKIIIDQSDPSKDDWRDQIARGARAYYQALTIQPLLTRAFFIEIATLSERATQVRRESFDSFANVLLELIEKGRAAHPEIPSRSISFTMAAAILGGMTDVMIGAIENDEMLERVDDLVETVTDLIGCVVTGQFPE
ncbi:MAG: TetR/AcrR family transcriptional regulator [Solirubrobacteraceae bacterium]|nr:TetR/AcrR family transcriptional regulator [Patulibacter sp.]